MTAAPAIAMPKERPILFSGPMVRAILEGRKTQTRRPIKLPLDGSHDVSTWQISRPLPRDPFFECWRFEETTGLDRKAVELQCPYGRAGDRLWVKEGLRRTDWEGMPEGGVVYAADDSPAWDLTRPCVWGWKSRSLPSMYCPRGLSRIRLEVMHVKVERLQDISGDDARREGIDLPRCGCEVCLRSPMMCPADAGVHIEEFWHLWDQINGKKALWSANPWVWVVEFRRRVDG